VADGRAAAWRKRDARHPDRGRLLVSRRNRILLLIAAVVVIDVIAFFVVPPFDPIPDSNGEAVECVYPICFINGNLELPAPHAIFPVGHHTPPGLVVFDVSISNTLLTLWIVAVLVLVAFWIMARAPAPVPGRRQNFAEWAFESLEGFATSLGGPEAKPYIPLFAAFFLLILISNWSGLIPGVGRVVWFRAPTSDVNVTIGLALVAWLYFQFQGFKHLGLGYAAKFFPLGEFRKGIGAGIIALFVGLVELLLEFVKPVTLSMRLFGNIYGGEVALGVLTALTVALIPLAMYALELMLNLVQALIFSTLTLMFTLAAIEHHGDEHDESHEPTATPVDPAVATNAAGAAH
jgi:F-type H+-transporting ATPase subunit a